MGGQTVDGIIESAEPRGLFRVRTDDGRSITASVHASAKRVTVKLIPGDRVEVELSPVDPSRGRITKRVS